MSTADIWFLVIALSIPIFGGIVIFLLSYIEELRYSIRKELLNYYKSNDYKNLRIFLTYNKFRVGNKLRDEIIRILKKEEKEIEWR
jgi:hypothetical protein